MAVTQDGKTGYVLNNGADTVTPVNLATNTPGRPITVGGRPIAIAITPNGTTAYVVSYSEVTPIATATNTAGPPIKTGSRSDGIVITPDGKTAYVANSSKEFVRGGKLVIRPGTVTPITLATNTPGRPIKVGRDSYGVAALALVP
jgi:YVTN family beta-propeller protein